MGQSQLIQYVKGVGPSLARRLNKLGIFTQRDFLYYFPRSYDDRRFLPKIKELSPNQTVTCYGVVIRTEEQQTKTRKHILNASLKDQTGSVDVVWFNQPFLKKHIHTGVRVLVKGKLERNHFTKRFTISVSESEIIRSQEDYKKSLEGVIPIYALSTGITQGQMRNFAREVVKNVLGQEKDIIPLEIQKKLNLEPLRKAIHDLHFPKSLDDYHQARYRVAFDEFFFFQLTLGLKKNQVKEVNNAPILKTEGPLIQNYLEALPYTYTAAQARSIDEVRADVSDSKPMNRLLQGDVGSGKTEVAVMTLLFAIESGKKGAVMVPTQILAEQHHMKLQTYLEPLGVKIILLQGKMRKKEKEAAMAQIKEAGPAVIVGTHAIIQDAIEMDDLAVAVIDEQHRFGVMQRMTLKQKGHSPHCLFMTATPIPRTFMITCFGDLDKSIMDEMPPGRIPPKTYFAKEHHAMKVFNECRKNLAKGEQLFVVYPLVEESEKLDLQSAIDGAEMLQSEVYPDFKVGLLHGRMSRQEKSEIMQAYKAKEIDVLVATTVIEVGIDVPNATMMIIQHAHRFGLSQLHQLRGRIGRSTLESNCYLLADPKTDSGKKRIQAMIETADGFKIAEFDLLIRGPGDVLGTRQSGLPDFKIGDIIKDEKILIAARKVAFALLKEDPFLNKYPGIKQELMEKYELFRGKQLN